MKKYARKKISIAGSLAAHVLLVLVLAVTGILQTRSFTDDFTEITVFAGGGGGGGSGTAGAEVEEPKAAAPQQAEPDAIADAAVKTETAAPVEHRPVAKKAAPSSGDKNDTGTGGGKGSGRGTGKGSGTGPGSGSGSGGGHGSGHGTGTGSGSGDGIAINPAVPPRVVRSVSPVYPETQRLTNVTGTVRLRLLIGRDGSVEDINIVSSSGSRPLDNAAVNACRRWRFTAAENSAGQKVRCYWEIPIRFDLKH